MLLIAKSQVLEEVVPHTMFRIGSYGVNNMHILALIGAVIVFFVFLWLSKKMKPSGTRAEDYVTKGSLAQTLEVMVVFCREEVTRPMLGDLTDKYIYYVWTTFFFVLVCNLMGLLPIGPILKLMTGNESLGFFNGPPTGNINVTAALALVSFFMIIFVGIRHKGWGHFKSYAPIPFDSLKMMPIAAMMVAIEVLSMGIKILALCIRLFANMIAGHMVIAALLGMIFIFGATSDIVGYSVGIPAALVSLAMSLMEVFVSFLQAYIFAFLTVVFIALGLGFGEEE